MKKWTVLLLCFLFSSASAWSKTALVFGGDGTENYDPTGSLYSAVRVAKMAGFETVIVTDHLDDAVFEKASVWIQPGGANFAQAAQMQRTGIWEPLKAAIARGLGYVGFCAGGYMAQSSGYYGLGLLPGESYSQGEYTGKSQILWNGKLRYVHYENGPRFEPAKGLRIFATYVTNGAPAGVSGKYGSGKVVISGPHPEAQTDWEPRLDPDGTDEDLAIEMIHAAARSASARKDFWSRFSSRR